VAARIGLVRDGVTARGREGCEAVHLTGITVLRGRGGRCCLRFDSFHGVPTQKRQERERER
jgi:hypothetical protein